VAVRAGLVALAFARRPTAWLSRRCLRGLPVLVLEVSRRVWGLRLRRTEQVLALSRLFMFPSAHYKGVGVRIASFRSSIPTPPILCLRFAVSLAVAAQDSRPSGSLLLSRKALSSSTSCRFSPAHCNRDVSTACPPPGLGIYLDRRSERISLMNRTSLLLAVILTLVSMAWAQSAPPQTPPPKQGAEHHHKMMEMDKQHMEAMKADVDKMKASLEQLKANVAKISEPTEKARWQANVDMWSVMVGHMEQMSKHMEAMGPRKGEMMHHHDMGSSPPTPPTEPKPLFARGLQDARANPSCCFVYLSLTATHGALSKCGDHHIRKRQSG